MSEPRSLPPRPDLRRLRDEAKRRRKAGEFSVDRARPAGDRARVRLSLMAAAEVPRRGRDARRVGARGGTDRLRYVVGPAPRAGAARCRSDASPVHDLACACVAGEADEVSRRLAARPAAVSEPTGPHGWQPILYACFSRLLRGDPDRAPGIREVVRRLLAAGADPNAVVHQRRQVAPGRRCTARRGSPAIRS